MLKYCLDAPLCEDTDIHDLNNLFLLGKSGNISSCRMKHVRDDHRTQINRQQEWQEKPRALQHSLCMQRSIGLDSHSKTPSPYLWSPSVCVHTGWSIHSGAKFPPSPRSVIVQLRIECCAVRFAQNWASIAASTIQRSCVAFLPV